MRAAASVAYQAPHRHRGTGGFGFTSSRCRGPRVLRVRAPLLDERDDAVGDLLDREFADLDHGAPETPVDLGRVVELVVDLDEVRVLPVASHPADALLADLR